MAELPAAAHSEQSDLAQFVGVGVHPMLQWHGTWRGIAAINPLVLDAARLFGMLATAASGCPHRLLGFEVPIRVLAACNRNSGRGGKRVCVLPSGSGSTSLRTILISGGARLLQRLCRWVSTAYFGTDELHFTVQFRRPASSTGPFLRPLQPGAGRYPDLSDLRWDALRNSTTVGAELGWQVSRQAMEHFSTPQD